MKSAEIHIDSLCPDACFTLGKIIAQMNWRYRFVSEEIFEIFYPEQDEDMFEFICGEFI